MAIQYQPGTYDFYIVDSALGYQDRQDLDAKLLVLRPQRELDRRRP